MHGSMGVRVRNKKKHTIQIQNKQDLQNRKLNIIQLQEVTDHRWYFCKKG
jgi:hypothetical protein